MLTIDPNFPGHPRVPLDFHEIREVPQNILRSLRKAKEAVLARQRVGSLDGVDMQRMLLIQPNNIEHIPTPPPEN